MSGPGASDFPPPPPPPDGAWSPPPPPTSPSAPLSQRFDSAALEHRGFGRFAGAAAQGFGLLFLFLGTAIVVAFGSTPVSCIASASACAQGTLQGGASAIVLGHLFWAFGLFGLAGGAGLQLYLGKPSAHPTPEETQIYLARRRGEFLLLLAATGLLFLLMVASTYTGFPVSL